MSQLDVKLQAILGKTPTYMRPPYFSYNDATLSVLGGLGYHVIHADFDTNDWQFDVEASTKAFSDGLAAGKSIVLMHDVHQTTVQELVPRVIDIFLASGKTGK